MNMKDVTILVVEDHNILREGLSILLESEGFNVLSAGNGMKALEYMEVSSPDLILSDITMPEMDGYDFYNAVRARADWVTIPFVFLTARGAAGIIAPGNCRIYDMQGRRVLHSRIPSGAAPGFAQRITGRMILIAVERR